MIEEDILDIQLNKHYNIKGIQWKRYANPSKETVFNYRLCCTDSAESSFTSLFLDGCQVHYQRKVNSKATPSFTDKTCDFLHNTDNTSKTMLEIVVCQKTFVRTNMVFE